MQPGNFILRGDFCYSKDRGALVCVQDGYAVCTDGVSQGIYEAREALPQRYARLPVADHRRKLIIPGLVDLHMHAPQFAFRGLGMDLELLDWLNTHTFPEEAKYGDIGYAKRAYSAVVRNLAEGPNTRACIFATVHLPATRLLMDMLEETGLVCMVGKVNMDRNCPESLCEQSAARSVADTRRFLEETDGRYNNTYPILTPRFIPSCSDALMRGLSELRREFNMPIQSHLSENQSEIDWVKQLCPESKFYGGAYDGFGLLGGESIMAHCVWTCGDELSLLRERGVYVAHCPQSNGNLASGIAPVRRFIESGLRVGLGSDVAGGCDTSIFRAMSDSIKVSKLRWRLIDSGETPLSLEEAFFLGTLGGGSFFGKVGSFAPGYEFDALVIDDAPLAAPFDLTIPQRLARAIHLSDDRHILAKYARGRRVQGAGL